MCSVLTSGGYPKRKSVSTYVVGSETSTWKKSRRTASATPATNAATERFVAFARSTSCADDVQNSAQKEVQRAGYSVGRTSMSVMPG